MSQTALSTPNNGAASLDKAARQYWRPWYRVDSGKESHTLFVALPGVKRSGVHVALEDDLLTITGHREDKVPENWKPLFSELGHHNYRLAVRLNVEVDEGKIEAKVEDGLLTLTLPVKEEAKPREIPVG